MRIVKSVGSHFFQSPGFPQAEGKAYLTEAGEDEDNPVHDCFILKSFLALVVVTSATSSRLMLRRSAMRCAMRGM